MKQLKDLGIYYEKNGKPNRWGLYECICGKQFKCRTYCIKSGHTKSCGCSREKGTNNKHGLINTRLSQFYDISLNHLNIFDTFLPKIQWILCLLSIVKIESLLKLFLVFSWSCFYWCLVMN